jgi:hypothetical protein
MKIKTPKPGGKSRLTQKRKKEPSFDFGKIAKISVASIIASPLGTLRDAFGESTTSGCCDCLGPFTFDPVPVSTVGPITYP